MVSDDLYGSYAVRARRGSRARGMILSEQEDILERARAIGTSSNVFSEVRAADYENQPMNPLVEDATEEEPQNGPQNGPQIMPKEDALSSSLQDRVMSEPVDSSARLHLSTSSCGKPRWYEAIPSWAKLAVAGLVIAAECAVPLGLAGKLAIEQARAGIAASRANAVYAANPRFRLVNETSHGAVPDGIYVSPGTVQKKDLATLLRQHSAFGSVSYQELTLGGERLYQVLINPRNDPDGVFEKVSKAARERSAPAPRVLSYKNSVATWQPGPHTYDTDEARCLASMPFYSQIDAAAREHDVSAALLYAMADQESDFNVHARSHVGAYGLFQFMPKTARQYGVKNRSDPAQSAQGAARYLRTLIGEFGTLDLAVAAYNAGPGNVRNWVGNTRTDAIDIPFPETKEYVSRVFEKLERYRGGFAAQQTNSHG